MALRHLLPGLVVAFLGWAGPIAAQGGATVRFAPGSLSGEVLSARDPGQRYAVFVPGRYDSLTPRPLLCVMDPRGNALMPLRLLRSAADRFGYIIFSSYNTRSDEAGDPNSAAVNAMIADAQRYFAIDTRRIYLVGFSGTSRAGWDYAYRLDGHVAGLIGFGAGFPPGWTPPAPGPGELESLAFYGGAGTTDFNYQEVQDLDAYLDRRGIHHHVASYDGPHGWPPEAVMRDALQWMELQAMRRGLIERDSAWIDSLYEGGSARAAELESAGKGYAAYLARRELRGDFAGLRDVRSDSLRMAALGHTAEVRRTLEHRADIAERHRSYIRKLQQFIARVRENREQRPLAQDLKELQIARLQREASDSGDRFGALGAAQLLEQVFVVTAFYEPREALAGGNAGRALALLEIADAIHPGAPFVCVSRKEVLGKLGRAAEADTIRCSPN